MESPESKWIHEQAKQLYRAGMRETNPYRGWYQIIEEALALGVRHGKTATEDGK